MLTPIDHAISRIKLNIPRQILEKTFIESHSRFRAYRSAVSIDALIKKNVIRDIVLTDCNLLGANELQIGIQSNWCQYIDTNTIVVRIPKSHTQNRSITEALNATYLPQSGYVQPYGTVQGVSDVTLATNKLLNSTKAPTISGTASVELINDNTISITGAGALPSNMFVTVMLEYDENMSTLSKTAYRVFAELCLRATKAYIWTNRIIIMDQSETEGGYDFNRFTSIIESYEDAYEMYDEYLNEKWRKISFMADDARSAKHLSMITRVGL